MTPIPLRSTARTLLLLSIALTGATLAVAQTPPPTGYVPAPPALPGAKSDAPDAKSASSDAKPATPDAKAATPDAKSVAPDDKGARRPRRAQAPAEPSPPPEESPIFPLAWLQGCWASDVNKRETREHWLPLRGSLMLGMSQTVVQGKTQDYEYLRMESRADGVYYVVLPSGENTTSFKFEGKKIVTMGDRNDDEFVFTNATLEFPSKIVYRRAREGWLYISVTGKVKGNDKEVTYPMRRISCETGEPIER